ncbi:hypothetical protein, partial [Actinophytocola sp.]|uniref:hypothetical protein n=1 Tax=Actinophytocola sp. TaxID=1872138 RepID=UPI002D7FE69E
LGLFVLAIAGVFVWATLTDRRRREMAHDAYDADAENTAGCHHGTTPQAVTAAAHTQETQR